MSIDQARGNRATPSSIFAAFFSNAAVDPLYAPYGLFVLRVAVGFDWIVHAFLKTSRGMETHAALLAKNGITPLQPELDAIASIKTKENVMAQAAHMHTFGANVFFDEGVSQDPKHSDVQAYFMTQGGLGMPDRDYYLKTDARSLEIKQKYVNHVQKMLGFISAATVPGAGPAWSGRCRARVSR